MVKTKTGNCCFKEARKGLLTARRMDLKIHASKLPMRKTRKAARKGIRVRVENNHGHLEQLKNISFPLLLPMELLLLEDENCVSKTVREKLKWH